MAGLPVEGAVFLKVKELELKKKVFDVSIPPGEIEFSGEQLKQAGPLEAEGVAEYLPHTDGEIRVRGSLRVRMEGECDRCLDRVALPVEGPFDLFYRPLPTSTASEEVEIDEGETEIGYYQGEGLELADVLREHILLALPMQQVCREACQGICPVCGSNRNLAACGCAVKPADDRWAALKNLKAGAL